MYNKILVPLDGSKLAECALEHVKAITLGCHVPEVVFLRVVEPTYLISDALSEGGAIYSDIINQLQSEAEKYIVETSQNFKHPSGINIIPVAAYGNPASEILEYAKKNNVDIIIMTSHGRSGISKWLLGSVADKVSHHATIPVLIVSAHACASPNTGIA